MIRTYRMEHHCGNVRAGRVLLQVNLWLLKDLDVLRGKQSSMVIKPRKITADTELNPAQVCRLRLRGVSATPATAIRAP